MDARAPRDGPRPWVTRMARVMDSRFRVPGTGIRFGLDPIIGLVPVVGDTLTMLIGLAMLGEARRMNAPASIHAKMVGNLALDWFVGLVPGIDIVLDTMVKAHTRNAALLHRLARERADAAREVVDEPVTPGRR